MISSTRRGRKITIVFFLKGFFFHDLIVVRNPTFMEQKKWRNFSSWSLSGESIISLKVKYFKKIINVERIFRRSIKTFYLLFPKLWRILTKMNAQNFPKAKKRIRKGCIMKDCSGEIFLNPVRINAPTERYCFCKNCFFI